MWACDAPLLVGLVLAFAITIIGMLAIPVAVLAWALACNGAFTLGYLAVAIVAGRTIAGKSSATNPRAAALRRPTVGLAALSVLWFGVVAARWPVSTAPAASPVSNE